MRCIKLLIEYDGTAYQGWQSQRSRRSVQDILEKVIADITGESGRLTGASRTDAGVHALGQVAVFKTGSALSPDVLKKAMNAKLPPDIRINDLDETGADFHPRYDAIKKRYFYIISRGSMNSAFLHKYIWNLRYDLDLSAIKEAAAIIQGRHNFAAFRGAGCSAKTTERNIYSINITAQSEIKFMTVGMKGDFLKFQIEADAFLRYMVRNIIGTLAEVGKGKLLPNDIQRIISSEDRKQAGPTAPAKGLFLEKIFY